MRSIVERLRHEAKCDDHRGAGLILHQAADEIERLLEAKRRFSDLADVRAIEANRLRQALEQISRMPATPDDKINRMSLAAAVQIAMVALTDETGK